MKKNGFSIVELMIAIAMATAIIAVMTSSFASLNGDFTYSINQLDLRRDLRVALNVMTKEIRNSGTFGNFSFHSQSAPAVYAKADGYTCSNDWCKFDKTNATGMGVGIRSYKVNSSPVDFGITPTSSILRIQYGGSNVAALDFTQHCGSNSESPPFSVPESGLKFDCLKFATSNLTPSRSYVLTSSNAAYLVNFASTYTINSDPKNYDLANNIAVTQYSYESINFYTPDVYSMTISNLRTSYYFVGAAGLYMSTMKSDGSGLTDAKLVSANIASMAISYQLIGKEINNDRLNYYDRANGTGLVSYYWCDSDAMNDSGNANCYNQWNRIVAVNIALSGQSDDKINSGNYLTMTESASVGWLW